MIRNIIDIFYGLMIMVSIMGCADQNTQEKTATNPDSSFINTSHLDHLYVPLSFPNGAKAAGIYIYAEAPDYHLVGDSDEGFTCVDDVSRAALVYFRSKDFSKDSVVHNKVKNLVQFVLEMQSANGYFYNFLLPENVINKDHQTSRAEASWWSWRALHMLTEISPEFKKIDEILSKRMDSAVNKLLINIKNDFVNLPRAFKNVKGIQVPQWLPAGSATDQAAIVILALVNHSSGNKDIELEKYIRKLADGIMLMQHGNKEQFPYSAFLSWENLWHAYGCDQAYALLKAGEYLKDSIYIQKGLAEVDHFYTWLLINGMQSSFTVSMSNKAYQIENAKRFEQIAYGIRPMIFAATQAFEITGELKYASIAAELASWFFGRNDAKEVMYDQNTGRGYDGIVDINKVNKNSGAESTIEALLSLQKVEEYPEVRTALDSLINTQQKSMKK